MVATQIFFDFHPEPWGDDPIWLIHIFQRGWFNHQLAMIFFGWIFWMICCCGFWWKWLYYSGWDESFVGRWMSFFFFWKVVIYVMFFSAWCGKGCFFFEFFGGFFGVGWCLCVHTYWKVCLVQYWLYMRCYHNSKISPSDVIIVKLVTVFAVGTVCYEGGPRKIPQGKPMKMFCQL